MEVLPPLPPETGPPVLPGVVAGEINFLPKLIRLLETLFIFRGAPLALVLQKKKKKIGGDLNQRTTIFRAISHAPSV